MKSIPCVLLAIVLVASALFIGCGRSADDPEPQDAASQAVPVRVGKAVVTTLQPWLDLVGTVGPIPERTAEISALVDGQITRISVIEGQVVEAGDTLIELDRQQAEVRLAGARAAEQRAGAALDVLEHGPRQEEIESARQTARQLAAVARSLRAKLDALRSMHEKGEISDVEFGQAQARFDAAEAESRAAEAQLALLEAGTRAEKIAEAQAELAAAQAEVAAARLAVGFCTIRSPISGVVIRLSVAVGAHVTPADVLATVIDTSELFVRARVPRAYFSRVKTDARADAWIEPDTSPPLRGSVARLGPRADPDTGDVDVFVSIRNDGGVLVPGLACRVRVWLPPIDHVLAIPVAAVADRDGTPVVTVVRDERAYEQPVTLGVLTQEQAQVLDGLEPGNLVATEGGYGLPDGCPVRVTSEATDERDDG